jgi:hypothetical protein
MGPRPPKEPAWLKTLRHKHATMCKATRRQSFCRICALVQKVKIRPLVLSPHVADLAGIENLKKTVEAKSRVVTRLKSKDLDLNRFRAPARYSGPQR